MNKKERAALRRFRRVQEFLTINQIEGTTTKLQVLGDVIRRMSQGGEELDASTRLTLAETVRQKALRDALWDGHMAPIARIARRTFGVPGMDVKFRLPRKRADNDQVLAAARGMVQAAEQHRAVFEGAGLPTEFLAQFRGAIETLSTALTTRVESRRRKTTSRETLAAQWKAGIAAVDVLDAIVKPRLKDQPELLAVWNSVKRPAEVGGGASVAVVEPDITPEKAA